MTPLKILVICHTFPSRTQTFVTNQVAGLVEKGLELQLFAKRSDFGDQEIPPEVARLGLNHRMVYPAPKSRGTVTRTLPSLLRLTVYALAHPLRLIRALAVVAQTGDVAALQILPAARRICRRGPYSVIHCEFGSAANMGLILRRIGATKAPVVTSFRGSDITSYLRRKPRVYRLLPAEGSQFLPVCSHFGRLLEKIGFPASRIRVHYSAIRVGQFTFREPRLDTGEPMQIVGLGRFTGKKGFGYLLQAVALLRDAGREVRLTLVGSGPLREQLAECVSSLDLSGLVDMPGWMPHDEVSALMSRKDLLVAPSVTDESGDMEGIPNVLKEAMASGLAVIATDHSGISDLVIDGSTGLLVPERDAKAIAAAVVRLMDHPELRRALILAARDHVTHSFDVSVLSEQLEDIYREAIADER